MDEVSLVAEMHRQMAFGAAILGGFAVTFLSALLVAFAPEQRVGTWAIGLATTAAMLLIVATVAQTFVLLGVPQFELTWDYSRWPAFILRSKWIGDVSFFVGIAMLFLGVGLSGWVRSQATGYVTATVAAIGVVLILAILLPTF